jgi:hypothetical protein
MRVTLEEMAGLFGVAAAQPVGLHVSMEDAPAAVVFSEKISEAMQPLEMGRLLVVRTAPHLAADVTPLI